MQRVQRALTMHFGPREMLLNIDVRFSRDLSAGDLAKVVDRLEERIRAEEPAIKSIFIEAEDLGGTEDQ